MQEVKKKTLISNKDFFTYYIVQNEIKKGNTSTKSESMCALISHNVYLCLVGESSGECAACVQRCGRFLCSSPRSKHVALPLHSQQSHTGPTHRNTKSTQTSFVKPRVYSIQENKDSSDLQVNRNTLHELQSSVTPLLHQLIA